MIRMLDQTTINKIAAGEVVERPASVVKELIENAIDAGATAITVEIKGGGIELIRISDNGEGIAYDEIRSAFLRHSTSKIRHIEDLDKVASLGFRGEALASIASVSSVELLTKTPSETLGARYVIEGGKEVALEQVGSPEGTTIIIKQLFYNTPVRKKFLKTASTESSYVAELINKLALGHPGVSFKYIQNNTIKCHTMGNGVLKDVIFNVFGKEIINKMIPIYWKTDHMEISGYLGKPEMARANRNFENYFINGRYVKSKVIQKAIEDAYAPKLILHRFPFVVLHFSMDGSGLDVNVHPTKMDVRFDGEQKIYQEIYEGIIATLDEEELIPEVNFLKQEKQKAVKYEKDIPEPFEVKRKVETSIDEAIRDDALDLDEEVDRRQMSSVWGTPVKEKSDQVVVEEKTITQEKIFEETVGYQKSVELNYGQQSVFENHFIEKKAIQSHKIIGQIFRTYWIVEFGDKYYIIDQHAAHERVLYEQMLGQMETGNIHSQGLLSPALVHVSALELERYTEHQNLFNTLGFDIEVFGDDALMIRGVPYIFGGAMDTSEFTVILDELNEQYAESQVRVILEKLASMSCKAAVKAHDELSVLECHRLIDDLLGLENPFHCPHGRPTIIAMTRYELEKKFKRIV